jgi:hypothetical protein
MTGVSAERVLVATDGGPGNSAPLDWVIARGRHLNLNVEMVTFEETDWLPLGANRPAYRREYADALQAGEDRISARRGMVSVDTVMLAGEPDGANSCRNPYDQGDAE